MLSSRRHLLNQWSAAVNIRQEREKTLAEEEQRRTERAVENGDENNSGNRREWS